MSEINYIPLIDLLNKHPQHIEVIKYKYLQLLSELTSVTYMDNSLFKTNIERINEFGKIIVGVTGELKNSTNTNTNNDFKIVASGTIIFEPKIIRGGKYVGHIEDIVVLKEMRGNNISKTILDLLKVHAMYNNCYKVILDCSEDVKNVYIKNGFEVKGIQMSEYLINS